MVHAGGERFYAVVVFSDKEYYGPSEALQHAVRSKSDPSATADITATAQRAIEAFTRLARSEKASATARGRASYNKALAQYLLGNVKDALITASNAQLLASDDAFIAAFANYLDRELARERLQEYQRVLDEERRSSQERIAGYQRLLEEAHALRAQAESALEQARQAEAKAHASAMASREAEQRANTAAEEARKTAEDLMRKLAIATARFDITLDDARRALAAGNPLLSGIMTEALLRARGNDPEVWEFATQQIAEEFERSKQQRDIPGMQAAVTAWARAVDIVLNTVGTVQQARAVAESRRWLQEAERHIALTQQEIWKDRAAALLQRQRELTKQQDVDGLRRLTEDIELALAAIPPEEKAHQQLAKALQEATENIKTALAARLQQQAKQIEERIGSSTSLADLEQLRISAAEQHAAAVDAVARWGIDQAIALQWAHIRERIETAILQWRQQQADQRIRQELAAVLQEFQRVQTAINQQQLSSQPTKFFTQKLTDLNHLHARLMALQKEWISPELSADITKTLHGLAETMRYASRQRNNCYNLWAIEKVSEARKILESTDRNLLSIWWEKAKKLFNKKDDEQVKNEDVWRAILLEHLSGIDAQELRPETQELYRDVWQKTWQKIKSAVTVEILQQTAQQLAVVPRYDIANF